MAAGREHRVQQRRRGRASDGELPGELPLRIPQVRPLPGGEPLGFSPKSLARGLRSERALKLAMAEMYVQGVSTRRVTEITRERCGLEVTSADVSRAAAELDTQLSAWRERPLGRCADLVLEARYEKVRPAGSVIRCAVLVAMGVREDGRQAHAAQLAGFPNLPWQRCQCHLQQNAQAYVPQVSMWPPVVCDLRSVLYSTECAEANERLVKLVEKYQGPAPKLAERMETNVPEVFAAFALAEPQRRCDRAHVEGHPGSRGRRGDRGTCARRRASA